jgi:hypothetical protein
MAEVGLVSGGGVEGVEGVVDVEEDEEEEERRECSTVLDEVGRSEDGEKVGERTVDRGGDGRVK